MITRIDFHAVAEEEMAAALDWYEVRSARAADRFVQEIAATLERIRQFSAQFPQYAAGTRRARLNRFPYSLVFQERAEGIQVLAVAHAKHRPGYWRKRMSRP